MPNSNLVTSGFNLTVMKRPVQADLIEQNSLLQSVLSSTPDPILVFNRGLKLIYSNAAADKLFGSSVASQSLHDVLSDADTDTLEKLSMEFTQNHTFRFELSLRNGRYVLNVAPLTPPYTGWVITLHDITHYTEIENTRNRMLQLTSHSLKNPLNVIMGFATLLGDQLSAEQLVYNERIRQYAQHMQNLIQELLNVERIRVGQHLVERIDLATVVKEVVEANRFQAEMKSQSLTLTLETTTLAINGDWLELRETIDNLISNAIKYTPKDGRIGVYVTRIEDSVQIAVSDTGYGIPQAAQAQIFQPFYRVSMPETRHIPGSGLGLSLVKSIIEAHGGVVYFDSLEGEGTTFFIELPIAND